MQHTRLLETVRRTVREAFAELGAKDVDEICESVLIRGDYYCGRRFRGDGLQAVWFIEEGQIKVHNRDGDVARVLSVPDIKTAAPQQTPLRRAA